MSEPVKKWAVQKPDKPVHVNMTLDDFQFVEKMNDQTKKHPNPNRDYRNIHWAHESSLDAIRGTKNKSSSDAVDKIVGVQFKFNFQHDDTPFRGFCERHGILAEYGSAKGYEHFSIVHDVDSLRKLAVMGLEFPGATAMRDYNSQLVRQENWAFPPLK